MVSGGSWFCLVLGSWFLVLASGSSGSWFWFWFWFLVRRPRNAVGEPLKASNLQFLQSVPEDAPFSAQVRRHKCLHTPARHDGACPRQQRSRRSSAPLGQAQPVAGICRRVAICFKLALKGSTVGNGCQPRRVESAKSAGRRTRNSLRPWKTLAPNQEPRTRSQEPRPEPRTKKSRTLFATRRP